MSTDGDDWRKKLAAAEAVYAELYPTDQQQDTDVAQPQQSTKRIPAMSLGQFGPQNKSDYAFRP